MIGAGALMAVASMQVGGLVSAAAPAGRPRLSLAPEHGLANAVVTASGAGAHPGETVTVADRSSGTILCGTTSRRDGSFSCSGHVEVDPGAPAVFEATTPGAPAVGTATYRAYPPGWIDAIAGGGDGGPATKTPLPYPLGVAVGSDGSVYVTGGDCRIRKIDSGGVITTVAGTGRPGFSGDGGPARAAELSSPTGLAVDRDDNLYIVDSLSNRIRRVDRRGIITTVAGTGRPGFTGDGGPATEAALANPHAIAVDRAGNLFITDTENQRVRKVDVRGIITTIAGTGVIGFSGDGGPATNAALAFPKGVAVSAAGVVVIAEAVRVRRIDVSGIISTLAGDGVHGFDGDGGPATKASLATPDAVAFDAAGRVVIADTQNNRVRTVSRSGIISTTVGGGTGPGLGDGGPASQATLHAPEALAFGADGSVVIADYWNGRLRKVDRAGVIMTAAGTGEDWFHADHQPATTATLKSPSDVAVDGVGTVYVVDSNADRVLAIDAAGIITTIAGTGEAGFTGDSGPASAAELNNPQGVAVDALGNLYIADTGNSRIRRVDRRGLITTFAGTGEHGFSGDGGPATAAALDGPYGLDVDAAGNVFVADSGNFRIRRIDPTGTITTVAGDGYPGFAGDGGPAVRAALAYVTDVAVDDAGRLYISDTNNNRIRLVDRRGVIITIAGTGQFGFSGDGGPGANAALNGPTSVAVDPAGAVYVADVGNHRIRRIDPSGRISTFAGTGEDGYGGDGGPAQLAEIDGRGVSVDSKGNVYLADLLNLRVREVAT